MSTKDAWNSVLYAECPQAGLPTSFPAIIALYIPSQPRPSTTTKPAGPKGELLTLGQFSTGKAYNPRPEIKASFKCVHQPQHVSVFILEFLVRYHGDDGVICDQKMAVYFNSDNLSEPVTYKALNNGDKEALTEMAATFGLEMDTVLQWTEYQGLCHVEIPYNASIKLGCNFFVETKYGDISKYIDKFQNALNMGPSRIHVLIRSDEASSIIKEVSSSIEEQLKDDPLLKWWPNGKMNVQAGMELPKEARPSYTLYPRANFLSEIEYFTVFFYGIDEEAMVNADMSRAIDVKARFVEVPKGGDRTYFVFIEHDDNLTLQPGDRFALSVDKEIDDREDDWYGTVIQPIAFSPHEDVSAIVHRPFTVDPINPAVVTLDSTELPDELVIRREDQKDTTSILQKLTKMPAGDATIRVQISQKAYQRQKNTLRQLFQHRRDLLVMLLGNNLLHVRKVDAYAHLEAVEGELKDAIAAASAGLNDQQLAAMRDIRNMPGGIQIVQGAPGTGKTKWLRQALKPMYKFSSDKKPVKALILAPMNSALDDLATKIDEDMRNTVGSIRTPIVVRMHSWETEQKISRLSHEMQRKENLPKSRPIRIQEDSLDLEELKGAMELFRIYSDETSQRFEGISDRRVTQLQLSMGWHMCAVAGIRREDGTTHPRAELDNTDWATFREYLAQYAAGEPFYGERKEKLTTVTRQLRDRVLKLADVVICTLSNAMDASLSTAFEPNVIAIDEAGKAPEVDTVGGLVWYPSAKVFWLLGDTRQLPPVVRANSRNTPFAQYQAISLMSRLILCGYQTVSFVKQHRAHSSICDLVNVQYKSLVTASDVDTREPAKDAARWFHDTFKTTAHAIFINVKEGIAEICSGRSKQNVLNVAAGIFWYTQLLAFGVHPKDIGITAPYTGQRFRYLTALHSYPSFLASQANEKLRSAADKVHDTSITTFDSIQGHEREWIIVDLTVTDRLGFLTLANRINVPFSRPRSGLIVIGNFTSLEEQYGGKQFGKYSKTAIAKAISWFKKKKLVREHDEAWVIPHILKAMEDRAKFTRTHGTPMPIVPHTTRETIVLQSIDKAASTVPGGGGGNASWNHTPESGDDPNTTSYGVGSGESSAGFGVGDIAVSWQASGGDNIRFNEGDTEGWAKSYYSGSGEYSW